jgi:hypothetical protein
MKAEIKKFELKHVLVLTARGKVDLAASKAALKSLVTASGSDVCSTVLLDFRDVGCDLSASTLHALARHLVWYIPVLSDDHRIAALIERHRPGNLPFNHAQFLELCEYAKGFNIQVYEDYGCASEWLSAVSRNDRNVTAQTLNSTRAFGARQAQF